MTEEKIRKYLTPKFEKRIRRYFLSLTEDRRERCFSDIDHTIEILSKEMGKDVKETRWIIESIGLYLTSNAGKNFYADYQKIPLAGGAVLWTLQAPGGGSIHLVQTNEGKLLVDCGYGINYEDWCRTLADLGLSGFSDVKHLLCTHGDADHIGMAGNLPCASYMHPVTKQLLDDGSRGFAAVNDYPELVRTYTFSINTISHLAMPKQIITAKTEPLRYRGIFPVIDEVSFAGLHFEVWESKGGHLAGQLFFYEENEGLLFTSDCLLNPATITKPRRVFGAVPNYLITSANINSKLAAEERKALVSAAKELDTELKQQGKRLRLCCGHGAVSVFDETGNMAVADPVMHYARCGAFSEMVHQKLMQLSWLVRKMTLSFV